MSSAEPDPDWYLDNVVVPSGPQRAPTGPVYAAETRWTRAAEQLRATGTPAARVAVRQGLVLTRAQARDAGLSDADVRRLVGSRGNWSRPRRSVLSPLRPDLAEDAAALEATAATLARRGTVVSHESAATLGGLPLLVTPRRPTLTCAHMNHACEHDDIRIYAAGMPRDHTRSWFGARVTTQARTIVDLARDQGVASGLVAADAALHERIVTPSDIAAVITFQTGWPGIRSARQMLDLADGATESPLESLTRLCLVTRDVPAPELQRTIRTHLATFRVDMLWPHARVVVEADGMLKYRAGWDVVVAEKRREEALTRAGFRVVRVFWDDVTRNPDETAARVLRELRARA